MYEFIPSRDVREYAARIGRVFTDFEKAAIIYRQKKPYQITKPELLKISEGTADENLKKQITERLTFEDERRRPFWEETDGFVYELKAITRHGVYKTPQAAYDCAMSVKAEDRFEFIIFKRKIMNSVDEYDIHNDEYSRCEFDKDGNETDFACWWNSRPEGFRIEDKTRFENAVVDIPNPFHIDDKVVVYNNSGEVSRHGTVTGLRKMTTEVTFRLSGTVNIYTFMLEKEE